METTKLDTDIHVMCLTASSFPDGVMEAYQTLSAKVPNAKMRRYFGISHPDSTGKITYKAATEEMPGGEAQKLGLESFTIKAGEFALIDIRDHMRDPQSIGNAFKELLAVPQLDPQGYCLEMYKDFDHPDVRCMVPIH